MEIGISNPGGILGHLVSNTDRVEISLLPDEILKLERGRRGLQIVCQRGRLWITQVDDGKDTILRCGERFVVSKPGLVLVQSFGEGLVHLTSPARL